MGGRNTGRTRHTYTQEELVRIPRVEQPVHGSSGSQAACHEDAPDRDGIVMQRETSQWPGRFAEDELPFRVPFPCPSFSSFPALSLSPGYFRGRAREQRRAATEIESGWPRLRKKSEQVFEREWWLLKTDPGSKVEFS